MNICVFNQNFYRSACITYDGFKDLYKLYIDGVKVDSGAFSGDNAVAVVRSGGVIYLGQDQDSMGGGFNPRQTWSGEITQFNIWDFPLEEWMVENAAECRSDILGNVIKWQQDLWIPNDVNSVFVCKFFINVPLDQDQDCTFVSTLW